MTFLMFLIKGKPDYWGQLDTNIEYQIKLDYSSKANSIIIKFYVSQSKAVCLVSQSSLGQVAFTDITDSKSESYAHDYQGYQANSVYQLVEIDFQQLLYIRCLQSEQNNTKSSYELYIAERPFIQSCINDCNGYNYPEIQNSVCVSKQCNCLDSYYGLFCQFQSSKIFSNVYYKLTIESNKWIYLYYELSTTNIELQTQNEQQDVFYSLVSEQTPQKTIPNLQNSYKLLSIVNVQEQIIIIDADVIYIGIYNNQSEQIEFQFKIVTYYEDDESVFERNKIIIILTACVIATLLLFAFGISALKTRKHQQIRKQVQETIRRNLNQQGISDQQLQSNRVFDPAIYKGFQIRFIKDHFKAHYYDKFIQIYPGLSQFEECAVCLEQMKNANHKLQKICSVTPCFHIFHYICLQEWLLRQKNCPFCRTQYNRKKIIQEFPWIDIGNLQIKNTDSNYLSRIKNQLESVNESRIELNQNQQLEQTNQLQEIKD
ncbi:unnamed protein product (macronuclear) [Paramecium tetraurelia]|uniref:RING-type domain-containing protein n=1 Tax=Paramecium tetraurelia TaxID=5888 RepID=A0D426_PARTE|nr:uncharacterized protein GSPATT00013258001 [Paramecium tetraurelia]CAK77793.1 unnamed protein product [Paramecium tetraurelia]|eukprot:XP_001445190.1 hypothetical protein (macronuclear) [Paramecium tetraurelia strain d4-2]